METEAGQAETARVGSRRPARELHAGAVVTAGPVNRLETDTAGAAVVQADRQRMVTAAHLERLAVLPVLLSLMAVQVVRAGRQATAVQVVHQAAAAAAVAVDSMRVLVDAGRSR